ncbi:uncharacterized protein LOC132622779 [Lycium barbarum]|uniref:uncharacterized protein LOC132622779 n=1 Tax=Lycium barbarum TaxID=112863 RepID=UPI00293EC111|nr:uncharacterized protein LOC132622779 [Lycium barbarum]
MSRGKKTESEEVEELLRAAEDDVSLKLSLNSHMARGSSTQFIDPQLDQRFQALRSKKTPKKTPISQQGLGLVKQPPSASTSTDSDDLFTRFAALKSSLPTYSSASSSAVEKEEDDDDEVEKVIKWAIDAARLDPSPPSETDDDDDDDDESSTDVEEDENSEDDSKRRQRKAKRK